MGAPAPVLYCTYCAWLAACPILGLRYLGAHHQLMYCSRAVHQVECPKDLQSSLIQTTTKMASPMLKLFIGQLDKILGPTAENVARNRSFVYVRKYTLGYFAANVAHYPILDGISNYNVRIVPWVGT